MNPHIKSYISPGNVVSTNADAFWESVEPIVTGLSSSETLELNLQAAKIVDSVGLNVVVRVIREAKNRSASVCVLVGSESLLRLCRFTRLDRHAEIKGP